MNVVVDPTAGRGVPSAVIVSLPLMCLAVPPQMEREREKYQKDWKYFTFVELRYLI